MLLPPSATAPIFATLVGGGLLAFAGLIFYLNEQPWHTLRQSFPAPATLPPDLVWHGTSAGLGSPDASRLGCRVASHPEGCYVRLAAWRPFYIFLPWNQCREVRNEPGILGTGRTWIYVGEVAEPVILGLTRRTIEEHVPVALLSDKAVGDP